MAKPKFDPNTIARREPSTSLKPYDFMRPMADAQSDSRPATPVAASPKPPKRPKRPPASVPAAPGTDVLPMPPTRQPQMRVNVNVRLLPEMNDRLRHFVQAHTANMQDTVELAIDEFLSRRGG